MIKQPYRTPAILILLLLAPAPASSAVAEEPSESVSTPESLALRHIEAFERVALATVKRQALSDLLTRLHQATPGQPSVPGADASLLQLVGHDMFAGTLERPIVAESNQIFSAVDNLYLQLQNELETARSSWIELRTAALTLAEHHRDVAGSGNTTADLATLLNARNKWLWLCGCFSACGIILTHAYTRRHERRRLFWVRRNRYIFAGLIVAAVLAVLAIPALLLFLTGNSLFRTVVAATGNERPLAAAATRIEQLTSDTRVAEIQSQTQDLTQKIDAIVQPLNSDLADVVLLGGEPVVSKWIRFLHTVVEAQSTRHLLQNFREEIRKERETITSLRSELDNSIGDVRSNQKRKHWIAAALGLVILAGFGTAGIVLVRKESAETAARRTTCPQCQTKESMKLEGNNLVCEAEIEDAIQGPIPCEFSYSQVYGELRKLMFPTLGINATGKTHWMAMNYRQLNFGKAPEGVLFERLRSEKTAEFDGFITGLLRNRAGFTATQHSNPIVHPLMFVLRDKDPIPFSTSQVIASLLDLGGIVTRERNHPLRESALHGDGFLFFLDPTRDSDEQNEALTLFREDVKSVKRLKPHQQIQRPLAVCLSKIDILGTDAFVGPMPAVAEEFYRALADADHTYPALSIQLIQARHEIVNAYLETLFPGWEILSSLKSVFGPRVCLFPLTPVGFQSADLGAGPSDFSRRSQDPYAILEPLLWLIHMNGYPILK